MEAVANPSRTKDIFFVADGTGGHAFAETLDQHRVNVARWRQIEKDAKDKVAPDADKPPPVVPGVPALAKPEQRGDIDPIVPVYGALRTSAASFAATASLQRLGTAAFPLALLDDHRLVQKVQPLLAASPAGRGDGESDGAPDVVSPALSAEERAIGYAEFKGTPLSFPVPAARRADEKAQAAQFGLEAGADRLPAQAQLTSTDSAPPPKSAGRPPIGKRRVVDVSEGTSLDPLLDKTYDLNTPKTVPTFKVSGTSTTTAN
jgi:UPF0755 protein